ncbi:MAG: HAMP domain-containing protein [Actinobacteria bacterium]|nr:HAMP domain-containing protein [Actinomycetota bacterium]
MTRRISLAMTVLAGLLVIMMSIPLLLVFSDYQYERLTLGLERDALVLASDLAATPLEGDRWTLLADGYEQATGVRVTAVDGQSRVLIDSEGAPVGSSFDRPELASALAGSTTSGIRYSRTLATDLRYVTIPIRNGPQVVGALRLSVTETDIQDDVRALTYVLTTILALVLITAIFASWAVARGLSRPLGRLALAASRVGEDPAARVGDIRGPSEIQEVADALDETAAKLDAMLARSRSVAADASHHLRTPLAAMRLRLETIVDTSHDIECARQAEATIGEVDRLTRRIDQVIAIATAETSPERIQVDVGETAQRRIPDWHALAQARGIDLKCDAESAIVRAPLGEVERIIDELVGNALNYAHSSVQLNVRLTDMGSKVELMVRDDGPGIPLAEREAVFGRFHRGIDAIPGGTGLGLSLVAQAAESAGGSVQIVDAEVGSCFEVLLPTE